MARRRRPWHHRARQGVWVVAAVLLGTLAARHGARLLRREPLRTDRTYRIERVVDADTLVLEGGHTIRLIGVDAPEAHPSPKLESDAARSNLSEKTIREMGELATRYVRGLCRGRVARVELDRRNEARGHRDRYGRYLAFVFLVDPHDPAAKEIFLDRELLREGYARCMHYAHSRTKEFQQLEAQARRARKGLWAREGIP